MKYILGAYSQIPYGASNDAYETLLENQIRPLLTLLYQNSEYKLLLRLGINVFEWFENNHPEINMLIFDLCKKEQLELLSSPDYDAILPIIPNHERSIYVEKTISYIRKKFLKRTKGFLNSYQIFNPSVISALGLCSVDYMITSTFEQNLGRELYNKPFYMEEMGKGIYVFPIDDRYSREVYEVSRLKYSAEKFIANMLKLVKDSSNSPNLIMINVDQISNNPDYFKVFTNIYGKISSNCTLPSLYLNEKEIKNSFYLPAGLYGRDYSVSKAFSVNQMILENRKSCKNYSLNNFYRDITHDFKKNSDIKKNVDALLMKAEAGSVYIKNMYTSSDTENFANKYLCDVESKLYSEGYSDFPLQTDIVGDRFPQDVFPLKNHLIIINRKGAVIERLSCFDFMKDLAFSDSDGLFSDSLKSLSSQKLPLLNNKCFELKSIDSKRQDVVYYLDEIEINKTRLAIFKRFRFYKNNVVFDVDFENTGSSFLNDLIHENILKLNLSETAIDKVNGNSVILIDPDSFMEIQLSFSMPVEISCKSVYDSNNLYKYHLIKISHIMNINEKQVDHLSINMKIEKTKEKHI